MHTLRRDQVRYHHLLSRLICNGRLAMDASYRYLIAGALDLSQIRSVGDERPAALALSLGREDSRFRPVKVGSWMAVALTPRT